MTPDPLDVLKVAVNAAARRMERARLAWKASPTYMLKENLELCEKQLADLADLLAEEELARRNEEEALIEVLLRREMEAGDCHTEGEVLGRVAYGGKGN